MGITSLMAWKLGSLSDGTGNSTWHIINELMNVTVRLLEPGHLEENV